MLGCLGLLAYFTYHGLYGKHGLQASHVVAAELNSLKGELAELQSGEGGAGASDFLDGARAPRSGYVG